MKTYPLILLLVGLAFLSFNIFLFHKENESVTMEKMCAHDDTLTKSEYSRFKIEAIETVHTLHVMYQVLNKISMDPNYNTEYDSIRYRMHEMIDHSDAYGNEILNSINIRLQKYNEYQHTKKVLLRIRIISVVFAIIGLSLIGYALYYNYIKIYDETNRSSLKV